MEEGGEGDQAMHDIASQAHENGLVGVPHFRIHLDPEKPPLGLFGREHLSLIRLKLHERGLAVRPDVTPHISHAWSSAL